MLWIRMNWIQGHALGRKFKALVSHDGKINQFGAYATDELFFIQHDQNGTLWNNRENYAIWDPLTHAKNFSTPHFIAHSKSYPSSQWRPAVVVLVGFVRS